MITIKDIARLANVSQSSVSKALNDRPDVSKKTKEKILKIVKEHNFSPNAFGKGLKKQTTENIGVLFCREKQPLSGNPFYSRVLEGIEEEVGLKDYSLLLHLIPECNQSVLPKMVRERQVDGVILVGSFKKEYVNKVVENGLPIVLVDPKFSDEKCSQVFIDNEQGAFLATQYLIDAGHKKIGFISGDQARLSFKQRYDGFMKALKFNELSVNKDFIRSGGIEKGYDHIKQILMLKDRPTAIFSANDINALYGYRAIQEQNLQIPGDISLIGFDDIDLAKMSNPPLTTIQVYKKELGSIGVRMLFKIIDKAINRPLHTIIPIKLIERESVRKFRI